MAIYRNVHISFWTDSKVVDMFSAQDKYFMLYCLTNPYTNLIGCYEISVKQMSIDLDLPKNKVMELINKFEKEYKVIKYNFDTKEMYIINWHKYNWTNSVKLDKCLLKAIENVKTPRFKRDLADLYNKRDTVSIPYIYSIDTTDTDTITDTITDIDNNKKDSKGKEEEPKEKELKAHFAEFVTMTNAEYEKLVSTYGKELADQCIEKLDNYKGASGKKYASDYRAIRSWVADEIKSKSKPIKQEKTEDSWDAFIREMKERGET